MWKKRREERGACAVMVMGVAIAAGGPRCIYHGWALCMAAGLDEWQSMPAEKQLLDNLSEEKNSMPLVMPLTALPPPHRCGRTVRMTSAAATPS